MKRTIAVPEDFQVDRCLTCVAAICFNANSRTRSFDQNVERHRSVRTRFSSRRQRRCTTCEEQGNPRAKRENQLFSHKIKCLMIAE